MPQNLKIEIFWSSGYRWIFISIIIMLHFRLFIYILLNPVHLYYVPPHKTKFNIWCVPVCWSEMLVE